MSWSLVTLSGRFCKKRILLGGRYSSGIWTAGRLGAGIVVTPATLNGLAKIKVSQMKDIHPAAVSLLARSFCLRGLV